jgi:hypothetical protein
MFILYGRRTVCIKSDTDNQKVCSTCNSAGVDVFIYRDYFHIFFIPTAPSGPKNTKMYCANCRERKWFKDSTTLYEKATRTPVYFYSGLIIVTALILMLVIVNINTQDEKALFVANPKEGDVYTIRQEENDSTSYYFLRLSRVQGDTIWTFHNSLVYFGYVSQFNDDDYFQSNEETGFSKKDLQKMLDNGTINAVYRNYNTSKGFDRIK